MALNFLFYQVPITPPPSLLPTSLLLAMSMDVPRISITKYIGLFAIIMNQVAFPTDEQPVRWIHQIPFSSTVSPLLVLFQGLTSLSQVMVSHLRSVLENL